MSQRTQATDALKLPRGCWATDWRAAGPNLPRAAPAGPAPGRGNPPPITFETAWETATRIQQLQETPSEHRSCVEITPNRLAISAAAIAARRSSAPPGPAHPSTCRPARAATAASAAASSSREQAAASGRPSSPAALAAAAAAASSSSSVAPRPEWRALDGCGYAHSSRSLRSDMEKIRNPR